jgi:hypothetical protein
MPSPTSTAPFAQIQEQILRALLLREALDVLGSRWENRAASSIFTA